MTLEGKTILVIGATSSIARAIASKLAQEGAHLHLAARDLTEAKRIGSDLAIRHNIKVSTSQFETTSYEMHEDFMQQVVHKSGPVFGVVACAGELGDQALAEKDARLAKEIIDNNYTGVVSVLTHAANILEAQNNGFIACLSSVAGDRGRPSNYLYGSAKGALSLYLQGLRARLAQKGVHVLTVKPGFVDTKMTFGKEGLFLLASPAQIADGVIKSIKRKKDVVYLPWFWALIMFIIRLIPEPLFKKLKL